MVWAYTLLCSKAYDSIIVIKRNIPRHTSVVLKKKLYLSLVCSHFSYCSQLWRPHLFKDVSTIEKVQRRATKFILGKPNLTYKKERLIKLQLLPLSLRLELQDILFLVKCFQIIFASRTTSAASSNKLEYKFNRTIVGRHFYFSKISRLWNHRYIMHYISMVELNASSES